MPERPLWDRRSSRFHIAPALTGSSTPRAVPQRHLSAGLGRRPAGKGSFFTLLKKKWENKKHVCFIFSTSRMTAPWTCPKTFQELDIFERFSVCGDTAVFQVIYYHLLKLATSAYKMDSPNCFFYHWNNKKSACCLLHRWALSHKILCIFIYSTVQRTGIMGRRARNVASLM